VIRDWSNFIAGRTALVTGSGGGVGRAIAIQMARAGAELRINDIHLDRAEKVCREIEEEGSVATPVIADVCERDQVERMFQETGPVDILVNNAGIPAEGITIKSFVDTGPEEWDPLLRLNLAAVLGVTRAYLPAMLERRWGRILTIVSDAGRKGERKQAVYGAAKAGRDGVTVNCISLGTMRHGLLAEAIARDPGLEPKLARAYPAGRIGEVDDAAPLAVLLCSDAGSWITGQVYPVDGGYAPAL
jgi:2-hydroxycyclohexanecarboxyl-CoA dehydrogenase